VWDAKTGRAFLTFIGHADNVWRVAFSADGKRIVSASWDKTVKMWDVNRDQQAITVSLDRRIVVNGRLRNPVGVRRISFSTDGRRVIAAAQDNKLTVWDATSGKRMSADEEQPPGQTTANVTGPLRKRIENLIRKTVIARDAPTTQTSYILKGGIGRVRSVVFSPDRDRIAYATRNWVVVLDAQTERILYTLKGHTNSVNSVTFSPDGQRIVSADHDGAIKIWDASIGQLALTLKGHSQPVYCVAFSSDGQRIASGSIYGNVRIWDGTPRSKAP